MPATRYADAVRNGSSPRRKEVNSQSASSSRPVGGDRSTSHHKAVVRLPHDPRFVFPFAASAGRRVTVQVKSGAEFEGVLHGPVLGTKNIHITLKDAKEIPKAKTTSSTAKETFYETLIIPSQEFVQMKAQDIPFTQTKEQNGITRTSKQNDDINEPASESSGSKLELEEQVIPLRDENDMAGFEGDRKAEPKSEVQGVYGRTLVPWDGGNSAETTEIELELSTQKTEWCQFEPNKTAVESTFSMDQYSSKLDIGKSKYTEEEASKIAMEIEASTRNYSSTHLDDSGVIEEDVCEDRESAAAAPGKAFSWVDAVKGKQQQNAKPAKQVVENTKRDSEANSERLAEVFVEENTLTGFQYDIQKPVLAHQMDTPPIFEEKRDLTSKAPFETGTYPLISSEEKDHSQSQNHHQQQQLSPLDPVWNESKRSENQNQDFEQVPVDEEPEIHHQPLPPSPPVIQKPEVKKMTSTVKPGISFKDIVKANLKPPPPVSSQVKTKTGPPTNPNQVTETQKQARVKGSSVDPATDPVVQSPRGAGSYAGKLITHPATNSLRNSERSLPSEDHLMSPGGMPHDGMKNTVHPPPGAHLGPPLPHAVYYSHKPLPPGAIPMMPPNMQMTMPPPHGYRDLTKEGMPRGMPLYPTFGGPPPLDGGMVPHPPHCGPAMNSVPPTHPLHEAVEDPSLSNSGSQRRSFQLNPMAKSYKPVINLPAEGDSRGSPVPPPPAPSHHHEFTTASTRLNSTPVEPVSKDSSVVVVESPVAPSGGTASAAVQREGAPPPPTQEYNASQGPPHQPPFLPPNVVTPWPSFPGTGVWHSGLGTPRPGAPGFMPHGMPSPYPVFMPGIPPFMGGIQDPMWRPAHGHPPMHGMPDQQSVAMMWRNYYNHVVPPNKRMWNAPKGQSGNVPMSRQNRNRRQPQQGSGQANVEMP